MMCFGKLYCVCIGNALHLHLKEVNKHGQDYFSGFVVGTVLQARGRTNPEGIGLFVSGDAPFNFSEQKYDTENLSRAYYAFQLQESDAVTLNLDHKISGVGGTAISVLNKYMVLPREYEFTFRLRPFTMAEQSPVELGNQ